MRKKLTIDDLHACENKLGITIPNSLKELYVNCNGGNVYRSICRIAYPPYKFEISKFLSIKYNKVFKDDPDFLLEGVALKCWSDEKLPKTLLPFAIDYSDGFLCININTGAIYRYIRSDWDSTINKEQNFKKIAPICLIH